MSVFLDATFLAVGPASERCRSAKNPIMTFGKNMDTPATKVLTEALTTLNEYYRSVVMKVAEEIVESRDNFDLSYTSRAEEIIDRYGTHLQCLARIVLDISTVNDMLSQQQGLAAATMRGPVPPTGRTIGPDTPLTAGGQVLVEWRGFWWQASVVSLEADGSVRVHYAGWGDNWDEVVPRSRMQEGVAERSENERPSA
jgi:hypothetical protein